jgi:hypothetical protein
MDLDTLLQGHRDAITVRRIYGDPVERDGITIVPAAVVMGGTGGGGDEDGNGGVWPGDGGPARRSVDHPRRRGDVEAGDRPHAAGCDCRRRVRSGSSLG